jgi:hypothetical protein
MMSKKHAPPKPDRALASASNIAPFFVHMHLSAKTEQVSEMTTQTQHDRPILVTGAAGAFTSGATPA